MTILDKLKNQRRGFCQSRPTKLKMLVISDEIYDQHLWITTWSIITKKFSSVQADQIFEEPSVSASFLGKSDQKKRMLVNSDKLG